MNVHENKLVLLGVITGVHGIKGEVKIKSFTRQPGDIAAYGLLTDESQTRSFEITSARATNKGVVARLKDITDRNGAEALKGIELFVPQDRLPPPDTDEWYYADLIGLTVRLIDGATYGKVVGLHNFGAGDLIEIQPAKSGNSELYPFQSEVISEIDVKAGFVTLIPPEEVTARQDEVEE